jgi:uncharacterized protein YbgA (DUF1722 family)/uncharacterized protein YbbK (DUF523 family)
MTDKPARESADIIRVGVSTCLLGREVRYDGGHKRDRWVTDTLSQFISFVPVCPELEVGMGVPRPAVHLEGDPDNPRMVSRDGDQDWTDRMNRYSQERVRRRDLADLCGYILKSRSPSCGMERVKVKVTAEASERTGIGLYARALLARFPHLPIEEEGRLNDPVLRDNFVVRLFAYHRLQQLYRQRFSRRAIIEFHTAQKYLLLAHSPKHYSEMGKLVAAVSQYEPAEFREQYRALLMQGLKLHATVKKNVNVLLHIAGYLKRLASDAERHDIQAAIADYHQGYTPLIVPITLIRHFVNRYEVAYIQNQVYLNPHPKELMLRNHV